MSLLPLTIFIFMATATYGVPNFLDQMLTNIKELLNQNQIKLEHKQAAEIIFVVFMMICLFVSMIFYKIYENIKSKEHRWKYER